jgi:hypothetical protein
MTQTHMKRLIYTALVVVLFLVTAPMVHAQCSGYSCPYGGCNWYNHLGNNTFSSDCAWGYSGTAGRTSVSMCGYAGNDVGYISRGLYNTGGEIKQTFQTSTSFLDTYSFEYTVETSNMQSGDTVKVYVIDSQTYPSVWYLVDTIATNVSCSQRSKAFNNPNWTGHLMQVRFIGNFSSTATIAYVDYVSFWQKTH